MWIWLLALCLRLAGGRGKKLIASAESAASHCMARLFLDDGRFWGKLSDDEWHHATLLDEQGSDGKLPPLDRPPSASYAPGLSRLACWQILVGPPLHKLSRGEQVAIAAYFEVTQMRFYRAMAALSWGADRQLYEAIALEEEHHADSLPTPCKRCREREGWAIAALLLWDLPRIYLGKFRYFLPSPGDDGYLGK